MADIILTCPACGKQTPVSEHVSHRTVSCQACQQAIPMPERQRSPDSKLKLRSLAETHIAPIPTPPSDDAGNRLPTAGGRRPRTMAAGSRRDIRRIKISRMMQWLSWLVFVALATAMYLIRFQLDLPGISPATLKTAGLVAVGIAYLVGIAAALRDNMFDGLLAIVVPLYPFYYLLLITNALFLRAIVAALLVGFGYDLMMFLQAGWTRVYNGINYWIQNV